VLVHGSEERAERDGARVGCGHSDEAKESINIYIVVRKIDFRALVLCDKEYAKKSIIFYLYRKKETLDNIKGSPTYETLKTRHGGTHPHPLQCGL
jgi:hypothetical protein